jgi:hypothetical protein
MMPCPISDERQHDRDCAVGRNIDPGVDLRATGSARIDRVHEQVGRDDEADGEPVPVFRIAAVHARILAGIDVRECGHGCQLSYRINVWKCVVSAAGVTRFAADPAARVPRQVAHATPSFTARSIAATIR